MADTRTGNRGTSQRLDAASIVQFEERKRFGRFGAELYIVLTDVPEVYVDFGKDTQRALTALTINQTERFMEEGQFPPGSMGPKVQAILTFLKAGGKRGLITTPEGLEDAMDGRGGTHFVGRI